MTEPDTGDDPTRSDTPLTTDPDQQQDDDELDPNRGEGGAG